MFCTLGFKNCNMEDDLKGTAGLCGRCGFDLAEKKRRIADIRKNGLKTTNPLLRLRGYIVPGPDAADKTR